jgi:hypothetical protein
LRIQGAYMFRSAIVTNAHTRIGQGICAYLNRFGVRTANLKTDFNLDEGQELIIKKTIERRIPDVFINNGIQKDGTDYRKISTIAADAMNDYLTRRCILNLATLDIKDTSKTNTNDILIGLKKQTTEQQALCSKTLSIYSLTHLPAPLDSRVWDQNISDEKIEKIARNALFLINLPHAKYHNFSV